ncbi:FAD-binding oxidoreductase [Rhodospirillum sp. A1_3_36]|uniref:FAD-binding oxidoreductase n=1 Tax=Rhodospirillum sp. A1_3_36 TaxID=3391666 RepID=UPI0039A76019
MSLPSALLETLSHRLGPRGLLTEGGDLAPYLKEQRGRLTSRAHAVARPDTTETCAAVVRLCAEAGVAIVPQGGNTGLVGGAVAGEGELVLSLDRMTRIRTIDPLNFTLTCDAGCLLAEVQSAATHMGRLFPLSLAAEGSCRIGGVLSTNAGGVGVLRYGPARDLCLGLEVVLPDGRIWDGLRALGKDNTGYALRHLFIGAEGTLGIITGAVLKLFPAPRETATAFCALDALPRVVDLLALARERGGDTVTAFEVLPRMGLEAAIAHLPDGRDPLEAPHPWYALVEMTSARADGGLTELLTATLAEALERGIIADATVAASQDQAASLWALRECLSDAQKPLGGSIKHDVSVPTAQVPAFIEAASAAVLRAMPGIRPCPFGHLGDGNIHFNLTQPEGMDTGAFLDRWAEMNRIVHDIATAMGGSISAEHGIGLFKVEDLARHKGPVEMDMMRAIKAALDPRNTFNPGKILPTA